jgi:CheY-like chemotaxis protein
MPEKSVDLLLVEPVTLLRRTVSITARSLGMGDVQEAANADSALRLMHRVAFHGAVFAIEPASQPGEGFPELALIDAVRSGVTACSRTMPIAVMLDKVGPELLAALSERDVSRVIVKPFRARDLLDAFAIFAAVRRGS